ncbi:MAG: sortase [Patescibacteria group bacterium]
MKKKSAKKEVYLLHIDAIPHVAEKVASAPVLRWKDKKPNHRIWSFVWDKIQFVLVSVAVFAAIYLVINWQAIEINLVHYWDVWRGYESPLHQLADKKAPEPEKIVAVDKVGSKPSTAATPPLNLEVYPPDMRLVIPRINQNVPVVGVKNENLIARKWEQLESDIQKSLQNGVIHYPGTALPGDNGNVVLTGHSSYYAWDPGRFKDVFALLHDVRKDDKIVMYFGQKKYIYQVTDIKVVLPQNVNVLGPTASEQLTLITCTPIGTNLKRLIVTAKLIEKG